MAGQNGTYILWIEYIEFILNGALEIYIVRHKLESLHIWCSNNNNLNNGSSFCVVGPSIFHISNDTCWLSDLPLRVSSYFPKNCIIAKNTLELSSSGRTYSHVLYTNTYHKRFWVFVIKILIKNKRDRLTEWYSWF